MPLHLLRTFCMLSRLQKQQLSSAYRSGLVGTIHLSLNRPQLTDLRQWHSCRCLQSAATNLATRYQTENAQQTWLPANRRSSSTSASSAVLSETTTLLRNLSNGAEIFLVGTAHVSRNSAEEVRELIRVVKPTSVMVELCEARARRIRSISQLQEGDFAKQLVQELLRQLGQGGRDLPQQFIKMGMQGFYRLLKSWGMDPGLEFKVAMEEAELLRASVVYGDADQDRTMRRISESLSVQGLLSMVMGGGLPPADVLEFLKSNGSSNLTDQVEAMKSRKMARAMTDYMRKINPELASALTDERDEYMVKCLQQLEGRIVGVVGLAHLDGIERRWDTLQNQTERLAQQ